MGDESLIKSVAIIGAGAAGGISAAAFAAENYYDRIRVFERRETAGGTWIYDQDPQPSLPIRPGKLPTDIDPPLQIPGCLPQITSPNRQERFEKTPIYDSLTTNVPDIAMSFSDFPFAYGPFVPHYIPRQYIENYFSQHKTDSYLVLNTTVEDVSQLPSSSKNGKNKWKLTLRKYDPSRHVDVWWSEEFDAVIMANGHYSVPYIPEVDGLEAYISRFPGRVFHSKYYRSPLTHIDKRVVVVGNSASGHDVTAELVSTASLPVYQSRRSTSRWDGTSPPAGISWKPVIKAYLPSGRIVFDDDSYLDDVDTVIYCTGYKPSFPFWNAQANGRPLWDYNENKINGGYLHTFFRDFDSLAIVGLPRALTFRSFEYQAIALARLWAGRNSVTLPRVEEQEAWERRRSEIVKREGRNFHDVQWENGETMEWLGALFEIAGLGTLGGDGRIPPTLGKDVVWAIENVKKYPEPRKDKFGEDENGEMQERRERNISGVPGKTDGEWLLVQHGMEKDLLSYI